MVTRFVSVIPKDIAQSCEKKSEQRNLFYQANANREWMNTVNNN